MTILGFKIALTDEAMQTTLDTIGAYITSQNGTIAPADKILYRWVSWVYFPAP